MSREPSGNEELEARAKALGFQAIGVAPASAPPHLQQYEAWLSKGYHGTMSYLERHSALKGHPDKLLPGCQSVVAAALSYNAPAEWSAGSPRIARYALGRDYHKVMRSKLRRLSAWVEQAYPGSKCRPCVDSAPIMERDFAWQAGLGFFGKNTMLIDSKRGSWFFIGLLLTTVRFAHNEPHHGTCGTCTRCVEACPTGAILFEEGRWQIDSRRCISYLTIEHRGEIAADLRAKIGNWTFGCDVCQEVCPFNEPRRSQPIRGATAETSDFLEHRQWPDLKELATIEDGAWDRLTRGSAVRRAGAAGIRRNALINLGNG